MEPSQKSRWELLWWYMIFGALHEVAHHVTAAIVCDTPMSQLPMDWKSLLANLLLRQTVVSVPLVASARGWIRHTGWMFSVLLAAWVCRTTRRNHNDDHSPSSIMPLMAVLTALEAISTDLLGLYAITATNKCVFYCGNFGVLLLHEAWTKGDHGKTALDILERMISVTMSRGAQTGGVVSFQQHGGRRTRVVNRKRSDLSKLVRRRLESDINFHSTNSIQFLGGHTRFATTSKATFDGTHPHQWTPSTMVRVYNFEALEFSEYKVGNYITHNGDFDFYTSNDKMFDLGTIQAFLETVLGPMPSTVDSCAIAGMVDLLRTKGSFGLSARYVVCFGLPTSRLDLAKNEQFPNFVHFEAIGRIFEQTLSETLRKKGHNASFDSQEMYMLSGRVEDKFRGQFSELIKPLDSWIQDESDSGASLFRFCYLTIKAFQNNDLLSTTQTFLGNAEGSFGLCVTSSLDADRQICIAARGQSMSVAFYPDKGLVCYGSEQAAVKAGLSFPFPGKMEDRGVTTEMDEDALRLDLDDLNGEVCLLDWGRQKFKTSSVTAPNRFLPRYRLMNGKITVVMSQENDSVAKKDQQLYHRMTRLTRNQFIKPLPEIGKDPVYTDIKGIPQACQEIQDDWTAQKARSSLNRLTAFNLAGCLRARMEAHAAGKVPARAVDILLTGCEVSLWLAEQFAADLQKAFPSLSIKAVSSNKLLGLFGQDLPVPALGFPNSAENLNPIDAIVIIVSHSGGTFAPLSCSNLMQSTTRNIFVVTSEWDTQVGKQLRKIDEEFEKGGDISSVLRNRIFTTEVGLRPAEPCSISVAATHQLLTNLFLYLSVVILNNTHFRKTAKITDQDLQVLETCNLENIHALSQIVGTIGERSQEVSSVEGDLRKAGDLWAEHVLENAKAYIMSAIYIFATVVSGYPLVYGIAVACGLASESEWMYLVRLFDAAIYFWLPQINVTILRLLHGRNLTHRMVGRTVAIADIPWVSQSADAFLSKIFACSYSIAGLNVLSGNPTDHFVHRHTHRVVRGTLLVCGRQDGRLSALASAEASACLSVNQASSIVSSIILGKGTCESITIGHNPFKLPLTENAIVLERNRPLFLCEVLLRESAADASEPEPVFEMNSTSVIGHGGQMSLFVDPQHEKTILEEVIPPRQQRPGLLDSRHSVIRSATALIGAHKTASSRELGEESFTIERVVSDRAGEKLLSNTAKKLFTALDLDGDGLLSVEDFVEGASRLTSNLSAPQLRTLFKSSDSESLGYNDKFLTLAKKLAELQGGTIRLPASNRDERGIIQIEPSTEKYFGEELRKLDVGNPENDISIARSQNFSQELYETRIASLQRFVCMTVMFHQMGKRVQEFFATVSFGLLGYRMDRTHSIVRIASTASPVSGSDVRHRMRRLLLLKRAQNAVHVIEATYLRYRAKKGGSAPTGRRPMTPSSKKKKPPQSGALTVTPERMAEV